MMMIETKSFKKTNVALMVLLSNLTIGVYVPYWFLTRKKEFEQLGPTSFPRKSLIVLLVLYSCALVYNLFRTSFFTDYGISLFDSLEVMLTFFGLGIMYTSVFRAKAQIEEDEQMSIFKPWLLVLFHIWYLQYKMNRLYGVRRENNEPIKKSMAE